MDNVTIHVRDLDAWQGAIYARSIPDGDDPAAPYRIEVRDWNGAVLASGDGLVSTDDATAAFRYILSQVQSLDTT